MTGSRFFHYELRTTDPSAAIAFYAGVLGPGFWGSDVSVSQLPELAAARGAPAHWLGQLDAGDVEEAAARMIALGGQQLGPKQSNTDGVSRVVLRDPFGAVLALSKDPGAQPARGVWHVLHTLDHTRALALYSALFGWTATELLDGTPETGRLQAFAWDESKTSVGAMTSTAHLPHVHPHWLFFFGTADMEGALAAVRERGGTVLGPTRMPSGDLIAACEDPQGAAFALLQGRP